MVHDNRIEIIKHFDYDPAVEAAILSHAKLLIGKTIKDILRDSPAFNPKQIDPHNKGDIGNIIQESWFGFSPNSSEAPDFSDVGIELKVVPLEPRGKGLVVKERTKICAINYVTLIDEIWSTSHAKKKLDKILFVYFQYDKKNKLGSKVIDVDLWVLDEIPEKTIIKDDWGLVREKVDQGRAHELSESLNRILAACRSGSGGLNSKGELRDLVKQPKNSIKALKRSFSLKQSYTKQRWEEISKRAAFESVVEVLPGASHNNFEKILLEKLNKFEGMALSDFAKLHKMDMPKGKGSAATIVKKAIGFKNVRARIKEFDQFGIEVRVVPLRSKDLKPWEAISFPAFLLKELPDEQWEEADIVEYVDRILFIPILRGKKDTPISQAKFGRSFFWSPSPEEWNTIHKEWGLYKKEVKDGKAKTNIVRRGSTSVRVTGLTKESETQIIHVRPHAVDGRDLDEDNLGNKVVKQSFWLNKQFIAGLVRKLG